MLKTWTKCGNHFSDIMYILYHNITTFCVLVIFHTFFTFKYQIEKLTKCLLWFSMGIDHTNPYIHSTTVQCDIYRKIGPLTRLGWLAPIRQ